MKILLVGGSGHVGSFITPYLQERHDLRVFDMKPPRHNVEFVQGSVTDPAAIERALEGMDTFIWLVMLSPQGGGVVDQDPEIIANNYEVNCKGLHTFLWVAQGLDVRKGVYTSTMSVHYRNREYYHNEDSIMLDTPSAYGVSKGFGEGICRYFARWFDMNLIALRITGPRTREQWIEEREAAREPGRGQGYFATDEEDLANAFLAAAEFVQKGHGNFEPIFIAGDENEIEINLSKAKSLLGWQPTTHLKLEV